MKRWEACSTTSMWTTWTLLEPNLQTQHSGFKRPQWPVMRRLRTTAQVQPFDSNAKHACSQHARNHNRSYCSWMCCCVYNVWIFGYVHKLLQMARHAAAAQRHQKI